MMEAIAKHRFARTSAQKARLVADQVRGLPVDRALNLLAFSPKKAAVLVKKVLESAIANAEHNEGADIDTLKVATIMVDEGPSMKRIRPRANVITSYSIHYTKLYDGELESTWNEPSELVWQWTVSPEQAPDQAEYVKLTVVKGEVVAVDDQPLSPYQILVTLNERAAKHGVGRVDITENRLVGMKSRGCYETPGGTVMMAALRAVEELVLDKTTRAWREKLGAEFSHLVYDGRWFTPLCKAIVASADAIAEDVNGEVVLKMYKGIRITSYNVCYTKLLRARSPSWTRIWGRLVPVSRAMGLVITSYSIHYTKLYEHCAAPAP